MSLEDRVKALEDEVKVLKNEIQTTLLDIQEQILTHYYPGLYPSSAAAPPPKARREEPSPNGEPRQVPPSRHSGYSTQSFTVPVLHPDADEFETEDQPLDEPAEPVRPEAYSRPAPEHARPIESQRSPAPTPEAGTGQARPAATDSRIANGHRQDEPKEDVHEMPPPAPYFGSEDDGTDPELAFIEDLMDDLFASDPNSDSLEEQFGLGLVDPSEHSPEAILEDLDRIDPGHSDSEGDALAGLSPAQRAVARAAERAMASTTLAGADADSDLQQKAGVATRELLVWVDDSVASIGKERTKQAIALYAKTGDMSADMKKALLELADVCLEGEPSAAEAGIRQVIDTLAKLNDILDRE